MFAVSYGQPTVGGAIVIAVAVLLILGVSLLTALLWKHRRRSPIRR